MAPEPGEDPKYDEIVKAARRFREKTVSRIENARYPESATH